MRQDERDGYRHLVRVPSDGRELRKAVEVFAAAGRQDLFPELLRIAFLFGLVRTARRLYELLGKDCDDAEFSKWFQEHGVFWFDIYTDGQCAYVAAEDAAQHHRFTYEWDSVVARAEKDPNISAMRLALIRKFATGEDPVVLLEPHSRTDVDTRFREYCEANGITILRKFQEGASGLNRHSWVYLAIDNDGLAKVFKELPRDEDNRFGLPQTEPQIYAHLGSMPNIPRFYGTIDLGGGLVIAKMSVCFGQSLSDYVWSGNLLSQDEACLVIGRLAAILKDLHAAGVIYLDLRPENVVIEPERVSLFDFNTSRFADDGEIDTCSFDPRYAAPETSLRFKASKATDVFQLGVLFHQLLTGSHPFVDAPGIPEDRGQALEKFALPNSRDIYWGRLDLIMSDPDLAIIAQMLEKDPSKRPTMAEVAEAFDYEDPPNIRQRSHRVPKSWEKNTVLFPARMGIPHKGHIDYLARLLGLGFHPIISIQRSYTLTERDPLPKWIVMKMVAQSLFDRGFRPDDFRFFLTPYYDTEDETRTRFSMMPGMEEVVAVASSNPDIRKIFSRHAILDQRVVFGLEGEDYEDRSWGEHLRRAVREGDYETFRKYAASGVERIMSFKELQAVDEPIVEFLPGIVRATLADSEGRVLAKSRVWGYDLPEERLIHTLLEQGEKVALFNQFARESEIRWNGRKARLRYVRSEKIGEDLYIRYQLVDSPARHC